MEVDQFIERWKDVTGTERANYQLFLGNLCRVLGMEEPEPATNDTRDNAYVFERRVTIPQPDGTERKGFIDLYRRGAFVCEAKQTGLALDTQGWDKAMTKAYYQADEYARALPAKEGRPPFIIVTDVGRDLALYADFSRSGANYIPFPDARSHRIRIDDLRDEAIQERLRLVWTDPDALDPTRQSARVTREIADQLAKLAKSLEKSDHDPELVSGFLMRCLFTMFSEDVGLLPARSFQDMLSSIQQTPQHFQPMMESLWQTMNIGGFHPVLKTDLLRFNGGLFKDAAALPLDRDQIELLIQAAKADWRFVEPSIFGTLLERALSPTERHKLGAHYTPRSYVERLVMPTVIDPLREQWRDVQTAAEMLEQQGKRDKAISEINAFHMHLCTVRILDPACGSGNFLYVALEHMKRLEGEVLNLLHEMGQSQGLLEIEGVTVDPHQFLGIEINSRAAGIAEMVLWIGYLQWHFRTFGKVSPPEPVLRNFKNIENRDALISYSSAAPMLDNNGNELRLWDRETTKPNPTNGLPIPDESYTVAQMSYSDVDEAKWPDADYIIGNPPFISKRKILKYLGDGYVEALREAYNGQVKDSADLVMYWWYKASKALKSRKSSSFGFITTNSISQVVNRQVIDDAISSGGVPISLAFAIPDHPWVSSFDGASVRIAMTVAVNGLSQGSLLKVESEEKCDYGEYLVGFSVKKGLIFSNLTIGANVAAASQLSSNKGITSKGVIPSPVGGFVFSKEDLEKVDLTIEDSIVRPYRNGRDISQSSRDKYVVDLYEVDHDTLLNSYPSLYQWLYEVVKPKRDHEKSKSRRLNWWKFADEAKSWRACSTGLDSYIVTLETAKHRFFRRMNSEILPDHMLVSIASDSNWLLGILSSRIHTLWAMASGSRQGVGNDPRYIHTRSFETFPFPDDAIEFSSVNSAATKIIDHIDQVKARRPDIWITDMYNVVDSLRLGENLSDKNKEINKEALCNVLRVLHDDLDEAVLKSYGWDDLAPDLIGCPGATAPLISKSQVQIEVEEELLTRLVDLNSQRAAEEAQGHVRYLRPDYQAPDSVQAGAELATEAVEKVVEKDAATKPAWPKQMRDQITAIRSALGRAPMASEELAGQFKNKPKKGVTNVVDALEALGIIVEDEGRYRLIA